MLDSLEQKLNNELLRYAVQRQMYCPVHNCGSILDVRDASLFMAEGMPPSVLCTRHVPDCFEPAPGWEWYRWDEYVKGEE